MILTAFWTDFWIPRDFLRRLGPFSPQKKEALGPSLGPKWDAPFYFPSTGGVGIGTQVGVAVGLGSRIKTSQDLEKIVKQ